MSREAAVRRTVANLVLVLVGLLIMVYPLTLGAGSEITCRGLVMQPGDTCAKADGSSTQTYEQRARARRNAAPVVMVLGFGVAAFGLTLLIMERRRPQRSKTVAS